MLHYLAHTNGSSQSYQISEEVAFLNPLNHHFKVLSLHTEMHRLSNLMRLYAYCIKSENHVYAYSYAIHAHRRRAPCNVLTLPNVITVILSCVLQNRKVLLADLLACLELINCRIASSLARCRYGLVAGLLHDILHGCPGYFEGFHRLLRLDDFHGSHG